KPAGQSYLERSQSFNERLATNMTDNSNMTPQQRDGESEVSLSKCLRDFTEEVANLKEAGGETLSDTLANWATAHYVAAAKSAARNAGAERMDLKTLRGLVADIVALRRGDHSAERLRIEREQLDLNRQLSSERMEKLFLEWAMKPENKLRICGRGAPRGRSAETLRQTEEAAKLLRVQQIRLDPTYECDTKRKNRPPATCYPRAA